MRPRFIALLPAAGARMSMGISERIRCLLPVERHQGDARLFTLDETPVIDMPHARGWMIGRAFQTADQKPVRSLRPAQEMAVESSGGRLMLQWVWGSYVAIWQSGDCHHVFREPSGSLPVFAVRLDGVTAVASDVGLLVEAGLIVPQVDWEMVGHGLLYPQLPTMRSHLCNVTEILPATRMTFREGATESQLLWQPWSFADPDPAVAASKSDHERLAAVIDQSVAAWGDSSPERISSRTMRAICWMAARGVTIEPLSRTAIAWPVQLAAARRQSHSVVRGISWHSIRRRARIGA